MSPGFPPMAERCGLVPYLGFVLAVRLSPTPVDQGESGTITHLLETLHKRGLPEWFGYSWLEFSANVAMFVPLGFLVALALSRRTLWLSFLLIPALSGAIEWTQGQFLVARFASAGDVAANTMGGYIGIVAALGLRALIHARDRVVIENAQAAARVDSPSGRLMMLGESEGRVEWTLSIWWAKETPRTPRAKKRWFGERDPGSRMAHAHGRLGERL